MHGKPISLNELFSSVKQTTTTIVSLSEIPTPQMPEFSVKLPCTKSAKNLLENVVVTEKVLLEEIPTPPMTLINRNIEEEKEESKINDDTNCLKKLIEKINSTMKEREDEILDETRLKKLWETNSNSVGSSESRSSSESSASISPSISPYTIDYLNSKCVYEENLIPTDDGEEIDTKREPFKPILQVQNVITAPLKRQTPTRCRVVNYILFPELREQYFASKREYDKALVNLVKNNCVIETNLSLQHENNTQF